LDKIKDILSYFKSNHLVLTLIAVLVSNIALATPSSFQMVNAFYQAGTLLVSPLILVLSVLSYLFFRHKFKLIDVRFSHVLLISTAIMLVILSISLIPISYGQDIFLSNFFPIEYIFIYAPIIQIIVSVLVGSIIAYNIGKNRIGIKQLDIADIKQIRHKVLWQHKNSSEDCVIEADNLESTFHIGAVKNGEVVGTSTFIIDPIAIGLKDEFNTKIQYRLRAMATSEKVKEEGIGKQIIEFAIEKLKQMKVELLWCDARLEATGFYNKMGFKTLGDVYDVPNIGPHKLMYIEI